MPLFTTGSPLLRRFDRWAAPALAVVALGLLLLETRRPLRRRVRPRPERWRRNVGVALPSLPAMVGLAQWPRAARCWPACPRPGAACSKYCYV